jgi:hypothetical protein
LLLSGTLHPFDTPHSANHDESPGLEPSNGGPLNCSGWQVLPYDGQFHVLRSDVLGGTRWQLQMKSDSAQTVTFDYTA